MDATACGGSELQWRTPPTNLEGRHGESMRVV
jgi:hypothetical protein